MPITYTTTSDESAVTDDAIASAFHEAYQRLAPVYGYQTRQESAVPWEHLPESNRSLMAAVVADLRRNGVIKGGG